MPTAHCALCWWVLRQPVNLPVPRKSYQQRYNPALHCMQLAITLHSICLHSAKNLHFLQMATKSAKRKARTAAHQTVASEPSTVARYRPSPLQQMFATCVMDKVLRVLDGSMSQMADNHLNTSRTKSPSSTRYQCSGTSREQPPAAYMSLKEEMTVAHRCAVLRERGPQLRCQRRLAGRRLPMLQVPNENLHPTRQSRFCEYRDR